MAFSREYTTQITSTMTSAVTALNIRFRARARGPGVSKRTDPATTAPPPTAYRANRRTTPSAASGSTNPSVKIVPTVTSAAVFSIISFISNAASATPIADAIVVFFVNAISTEPSGMMTARKACGSRTIRRFCAERQAQRPGRLGLAERHGVHPGAHRLTYERRGVDRETEHRQPEVAVLDRRQRLRIDQRDPERLRQAERTEQDDQRQRGVAHHVDVGRPDPVEHRHGRQPHRGQRRAEDQRSDRGEDRQLDRGPERLEDLAAILGENLHFGGGPLRSGRSSAAPEPRCRPARGSCPTPPSRRRPAPSS